MQIYVSVTHGIWIPCSTFTSLLRFWVYTILLRIWAVRVWSNSSKFLIAWICDFLHRRESKFLIHGTMTSFFRFFKYQQKWGSLFFGRDLLIINDTINYVCGCICHVCALQFLEFDVWMYMSMLCYCLCFIDSTITSTI